MNYIYLKQDLSRNLQQFDVGIVINSRSNEHCVKFLRDNIEISVCQNLTEFFDISQTGDDFDKKVCDRCFKYLPTSDFEENRIKKGGKITRRPSCCNCRKIKNGYPISKKDRAEWNKKKPQDFTLFTCPICNKTTIAKLCKIVLDHCHRTGKVRGWVCESCNTGIGRFDDDPEIVSRAIKWLSLKEN
jgi:hypothetical protein